MGRKCRKDPFIPDADELLTAKIAATAIRTVEYDLEKSFTNKEFARLQESVVAAIRRHTKSMIDDIADEIEERIIRYGLHVPNGCGGSEAANPTSAKFVGSVVREILVH
jgi:hypothetical protein